MKRQKQTVLRERLASRLRRDSNALQQGDDGSEHYSSLPKYRSKTRFSFLRGLTAIDYSFCLLAIVVASILFVLLTNQHEALAGNGCDTSQDSAVVNKSVTTGPGDGITGDQTPDTQRCYRCTTTIVTGGTTTNCVDVGGISGGFPSASGSASGDKLPPVGVNYAGAPCTGTFPTGNTTSDWAQNDPVNGNAINGTVAKDGTCQIPIQYTTTNKKCATGDTYTPSTTGADICTGQRAMGKAVVNDPQYAVNRPCTGSVAPGSSLASDQSDKTFTASNNGSYDSTGQCMVPISYKASCDNQNQNCKCNPADGNNGGDSNNISPGPNGVPYCHGARSIGTAATAKPRNIICQDSSGKFYNPTYTSSTTNQCPGGTMVNATSCSGGAVSGQGLLANPQSSLINNNVVQDSPAGGGAFDPTACYNCNSTTGICTATGEKASTAAVASNANIGGSGYAGDGGSCGDASVNLLSCDCPKSSGNSPNGVTCLGSILKIALFVLTSIVGLASVGGIGYAAILYASAEDNASNTSKAKEFIRNIVIGLVVYGLMIALIGWLIPGSVFG